MSSEPDTELRSVSKTPDFKLSTSILDTVLLSTSIVLFVKVSVVALPTSVSAAAGKVTVTSAVEAGPINVTAFVPLSVSSLNSIEPAAEEEPDNTGAVSVLLVNV